MRPVYVAGCGYWQPEVPSWRARASGARDPAAREPPCAGVPSRLLRGTSVVTRAAVDALVQAAREGGASLATVPTVFASELGEVQTAVALLGMIRAEGIPSPMRFKNSVHNAASGTASIAFENRAFSTALSAGDELVAMALLEAWSWLEVHGGDAVLVLAEEEIPAPLPGHGAYPSCAFGFHLRAGRPGEGPRVRLEALRIDDVAGYARPVSAFAGSAVAPAFALLDAVTQRRAGTVALARGGAPWCVDVVVEGA